MIQKQYLLKYTRSPNKNDYALKNTSQTHSPKIQYSNSPRNNKMIIQNRSNPKNNQNNYRTINAPYQQSSQSYSEYYYQKGNVTNQISAGGTSYPSKFTRTQNSKDKLKHLHQIQEQQENIMKLKKKYSNSKQLTSSVLNSHRLKNQKLSKQKSNQQLISGNESGIITGRERNYNLPNQISQKQKHNYLRTEYSKDKSSRQYSRSKGHNQNSHQPVNVSNTQNNITQSNQNYSQSIQQMSFKHRSRNAIKKSQNKKFNTISPAQEYYSTNNQQETSRQLSRTNNLRRNLLQNSNNASTVNTQNRPSSMSLNNRLSKKKMLTFYQCDVKKYYKYNDEGYLTDRQLALRQKVQKQAEDALDRIIIEQQQQESQYSKIHKSKSVGHFPKLNKLRQQAQQQRKRKYELYGKYQLKESNQNQKTQTKSKVIFQVSKQKSYNPSELPPSSSLSKRKFNVIYKQGQNENILTLNHINDDSYHEREAKRKQQHIKQVNEKARSSIIEKSNKKKSLLSPSTLKKDDFEQMDSDKSSKPSNKKYNAVNQLSPKGISRIGGITSQQMLSSNQNVHMSASEGKTSNLQDLSQSSISSEVNHSSHGKQSSQKKSQQHHHQQPSSSTLNKKQNKSISKSSLNQNLQMINSNYKKVTLNQNQFNQFNHSIKSQSQSYINQSLKMNTNTQKKHSHQPVQNNQIQGNHHDSSSYTQQENFDDDQSISQHKKSQKSVKSSHIGLTKQNLKHKTSKHSKQSNYASQSLIQTSNHRKSSLKKWVRQNQLENNSSTSNNYDIKNNNNYDMKNNNYDMKKKISYQQNIQQNNNKNVRESIDIRQLELDSVKKIQKNSNNRFSIDTNTLKLDSAINGDSSNNKQKSLKSNSKGVDQKSLSKVSFKNYENSQENSELQVSQARSTAVVRISGKIQEQQLKLKSSANLGQSKAQIKKSKLSSQQQSYRSKASSRQSSRKSHTKIYLNNISNNITDKKSNEATTKYGNLLMVQNSISSDKNKSSPQSKVSYNNKIGTNSQNSQYSKSYNQQISQNNYQEQPTSSVLQFNLIERAQKLLQYEDQLHDRRKQLQQQNMTEQFDQVLAKIQAHIYILREILQIATTSMDIYSSDSTWVFKSCLLSLKKYHLQRVKMVQALRGKKSCFKIAQNQLQEQDLKQVLKKQEIILLAKDMQTCNEYTQKLIEQFIQYLRQYMASQFLQSQFNLRIFDDRFDLGVLLQEYRTQILSLRQKTNSTENIIPNNNNNNNKNDDEVMEQQTQEIIHKRIFKLMEVGFLLSQLAGKRIKQFTEEIDIEEQFQEYFKDNWPYFERIVKTFS